MMQVKQIGLWSIEDSWGDTSVEVGSEVWVIKNVSGIYTSPYKVKIVSDVHTTTTSAFLVLVETSIDDYYDHVSYLDFIGNTRESCSDKFNKFRK